MSVFYSINVITEQLRVTLALRSTRSLLQQRAPYDVTTCPDYGAISTLTTIWNISGMIHFINTNNTLI